jgi:hypothetical protein
MIDTTALHAAIKAHVKHITKTTIPIGLHWQIIQLLDQTGRIPNDEAVKALHINVACKCRTIAKIALEKPYSSQKEYWPLHIHMLVVPLLKDIMNGQVKKDIHHLIG